MSIAEEFEFYKYEAGKVDFYRDKASVLYEELQHYKDLEEQGRLIELPCKVGDTVWCLEEDGYTGYVFIAMSGEYYIVSASYVNCDDIYEQLEEMEDDTEYGLEPSVSVFHKDKVFLTKEEAEAKLKELEGGKE